MAKKKTEYIHLFPDLNWQNAVTINWQPLERYDDFLGKDIEAQGKGFFYKIVAKRGDTYRLLYIGKAYKQWVTDRLGQHGEKILTLKDKHKNYSINVSMGNLDEISRKQIKEEYVNEVESLLIYSHSDTNNFPYLENKNNVYSHNVTRPYKITNKGELADGMYKTIIWDMFTEK